MTTFSGSPKLLKGGLVIVNPETAAVRGVIAFQYNPETITRSLQIQAAGADGATPSQALRVKGPAVETYKLEIVINAADALEFPEKHPDTARHGLQPRLAALECLVHPNSAQLYENNRIQGSGTLEILPMQQPLPLLVWSRTRIAPVRITEMSITEEAFDPDLNPIQAKVSLGLRVLSVDDLGFDNKGGSLFMAYLQQKEALAQKSPGGALSAFGIGGIG